MAAPSTMEITVTPDPRSPVHVPMYDWAFLLVGGAGVMLVG